MNHYFFNCLEFFHVMTLNKEELLKEIKSKTLSQYKRYVKLLKEIESKKDSEVHATLWEVRAFFELCQIQLKHYLDKEYISEPWQHEFLKKKETKFRDKAIERLKEFNLSTKKLQKRFDTDLEAVFQYIWKIKATISMVIDAFPIPKYKLIDGELKREREDIFVL